MINIRLRGNVTIVENAFGVRSSGLEMEAVINITQDFIIGGSFSYVDAEYKDFISPADGDLSGNRLIYTLETSPQFYAGYEKYFKKIGSLTYKYRLGIPIKNVL